MIFTRKQTVLDKLESAWPCCYRSSRQNVGREKAGGRECSGFYNCACPGVVPEQCVLDKTFATSGPEIDGYHNQDGRTRQIALANCQACDRRAQVPASTAWRPGELRFVRYADLCRDTLTLVPKLPRDVIGVAGIPRSGMLPAAILATALHVPLYSCHKDEGLRAVGAGSREKLLPDGAGTLLVVDDSVFQGTAIRWARQQLVGHRAVFAAVYTRRPKLTECHAVELASPHIFEWNIFNNPIVSGSAADKRLRGGIAFDFDGVLCENPIPPYDPREWLPRAIPTPWLPRGVEIPLVVSFRLERWRAASEAWLAAHGCRVKRLALHQARSERERDAALDVAGHKGAAFRDSPCGVMFESEPQQARVIADVAGKPVIVPRTGEVFLP
jgi:hypothetical protein